MFDVYMEGHSVDPRARARMMMALVASLAVTTAAGTMSWAAGRLSIGTVGPPSGVDMLELTLMTDLPPQKADPPERSKPAEPDDTRSSVAQARMTTRPRRGDRKPSDDGPPTETATRNNTGVGDPSGTDDGEIGIPGPKNQPGCLGVGCIPDGPPIIRDPLRPSVDPAKPQKERAPLSVLKARSVYTPDPQPAALAKTKTGLGSRAPGAVKVEFCVGTDGRVSSAKIAKRFGSDPEVDRICKAAVKKWRFKPATMGGKKRTTCSDVTFDIRFE